MSKKQPEVEPLVGHRQSGESNKAIQALNDWLRLGVGRTLPALLAKYTETHQNTPPTKSLDTLKQWSSDYGWAIRATEYDAAWEDRKNAERQRVMNAGFALDYQRVKRLTKLATFLEQQIYERGAPDADGYESYHNVWVPDVRLYRDGDKTKEIPIEKFNPALIEQFRKTLDDIAQETGGRIKKTETDLSTGGQPISVTFNPVPARDEPPG